MDNTVEVQVQELGKVMITNRGEYISSKSYEILDIVSYNGSSFISKIDDNTSVPAEEISPDELLINENWQLVAKKGDTYKVTEKDLQAIAKQITDNANSAFNQNVEAKTKEFNTNVTNKINDYDTNAKSTTEIFDANAKKKLDEYNANDTKKLKAYNDNADSKLGAYNTNDTNKLAGYNTNADSKMEEYNANATSKIAEYDEHSEELRNMAVSTDNELERVKNEILDTGSASDSFVHVEDSCMAKIKELEINGVINQKTTTGKNLLDYISNLRTSSNGLTNTLNEDGSITTTGKPIANYSAITKSINITDILENGQTYTISRESTNNKIYIQIMAKKATDGTLAYVNNIFGSNSFKVDKTTYVNYNMVIQTNTTDIWGDAPLTITNKYMLYKGTNTTDTSFEPYTGGKPSPNPNYPQEIKALTGDIKLTSCDNGLFDGKFRQGSWNSINNNTRCFSKNNIHVESGHYLLITDLDINNYRYGILVSDGNYPTQIENFSYNSGWKQANKFVFSLTKSGNLGINVSFVNDAIIGLSTLANVKWLLIKLDLVSIIEANLPEGEFIGYINATNYDTLSTKYNSNAGVYQWVLNKCIAKITIDGTKGSFSMPSVGRFNIDNIISNYLKTSQSYGITTKCDNYISFPQTLSNSEYDSLTSGYDYGIGLGGGTANNIRIKNINFSNVEDFKNNLKQHPITLYYILNTKSRQTLNLGVIDMPLSYKEITNIFTDSDLLPAINAKYYRTFETTIQNLQINEKSLKQEIADLNSSITNITKRLEALESSNVNTVEESEASNDLQN